MILSFWRRAHLLLALIASLFLLITSITGVILSFSPISNALSEFSIQKTPPSSLASLVTNLQQEYAEVIEIKVTTENFLEVSAITNEGDYASFYAHPSTGKKIGEITQEHPLFAFSRSLHRSLFLGELGRSIIGCVAFLLLFIAISGIVLVAKRQLGLKWFFSPVIREHFLQYWHVILGRSAFIVIVLISLTGTYLSLHRFGLIPEDVTTNHSIDTAKLMEAPRRSASSFQPCKTTYLSDLASLQFPFSPDPEDYFVLKCHEKELIINQFSGEVISEQSVETGTILANLSFNLHTGKGSILWSIILGLASMSILFFIFSGFKMTLQRIKGKAKNVHSKDASQIVLLVGSEGGNSLRLARKFQQILIESGQRVYLDELDNYQTYLKMHQLVVFTSTYGNGEAPSNAQKFIRKLAAYEQTKPFNFSVVGFGSSDYPYFCRFGEVVHEALENVELSTGILPLHKINKRSSSELKIWLENWSAATRIKLTTTVISTDKTEQTTEFEVLERTPVEERSNCTFMLKLEATSQTFQSGDLLAVQYAKKEEVRYYSIGRALDGRLQLCVRKHDHGRCSTYLSRLQQGDKITGYVHVNPTFHLPPEATKIIGIANGTGIAPFIGMANEINSSQYFHLYWGGKSSDVLAIFEPQLAQLQNDGKIQSFAAVFSAEIGQESRYVQSLLVENATEIAESLNQNAVILLCGSLKMRTDVLKTLDTIVRVHNNTSVVHYEKNGQIKIDCY